MKRRIFLQAGAGALAAPFISRIPCASAAAAKFDPDFGTAAEAVRALRSGVISSRELTAHVYARIKQHNAKVNAFVTLTEERAMQRAKEADEALAKKKPLGPLAGLPMLIKDSFATAGVRTTSGFKPLENHVPAEDAVAVARLKRAGVVIVGKTNLPALAADIQSYNEIAGVTNNPWDARRTSGGSTGGGAAALAAGFGFLELGSDIGGSIRTPSNFCGVYGHKPTLGVVPSTGHIPPLPGQVEALADLPVVGPMARSAEDLKTELEIIAGPEPGEDIAYRWALPAPRRAKLADYRLGFVLDDPSCPLTAGVKEVLTNAVDALRKKGARLVEGWPPGVSPTATFDLYFKLLAAFFSPEAKPEETEGLKGAFNSPFGRYAKLWVEGTTASHKDWLALTGERLKARAAWQSYFKTHDAFLMPANFMPAFAHDHAPFLFGRVVETAEGKRSYVDLFRWISFATLTGCPATVAPAGRTKENLPVGIQIMGPFLEDATPIDVAARLADAVGGFVAPPGFGQ
jgi:amidase